MQQYLTALAELFKLVAIYSDKQATGQLAKLLELSRQPVATLTQWRDARARMESIADSIVLQEIDDYLEDKVKQ